MARGADPGGVAPERLVEARRLEGISGREGANGYLETIVVPNRNERFPVMAKHPADLHRRVPRGSALDQVRALAAERVVQNDGTVRWRKRWSQSAAAHRRRALAGRRGVVREQVDGAIALV